MKRLAPDRAVTFSGLHHLPLFLCNVFRSLDEPLGAESNDLHYTVSDYGGLLLSRGEPCNFDFGPQRRGYAVLHFKITELLLYQTGLYVPLCMNVEFNSYSLLHTAEGSIFTTGIQTFAAECFSCLIRTLYNSLESS